MKSGSAASCAILGKVFYAGDFYTRVLGKAHLDRITCMSLTSRTLLIGDAVKDTN